MKVLQFTILVILITQLSSCRRDPLLPISQNCDAMIDSASTAYFLEDAKKMAADLIAADPNHAGYNQVILDHESETFFLSKLSTIYQSGIDTNSALHDIIFNYKIHYITGSPALKEMTIKFSDSLGLRNEFLTQPGNTTNTFLNQLYNDYGYTEYQSNSYNNNVHVFGSEHHNMNYISRKLKEDDEIIEVYESQYFLDGNSISYIPGYYDDFIFDYGFGDCPSGCTGHHYWKIRVDYNCNVELVEEWGAELPE